jgi:pimeloyl-ACP methyl ester carboxylesterase
MVLLHGLFATAAINWPGAFDALSSHFRVVALDQRGHGRGLRSYMPFRLEDCADDVVALADVLGIERIIPVGYSMGGPVAMLTARRHPDRVRGMVLCATSATFGDRGNRLRYSDMLSVSLRLMPEPVRRQMAVTMMQSMTGTRELPPSLVEEVRRHDPAALVEASAAVRRFDARRWIESVRTPTASVLTAQDRIVPPSLQWELARLTRASVHTVDAGHDVAMRQPRLFLPALVAACLKVAAPASWAPRR